MYRPVGVSSGGRQTKTAAATAGEISSRRTRARASATLASGRQDDRLRRHEAAGGVLVVAQQAPDVGRLVRVHQGEQLLGLLLRQLGEQVGGVVRLHGLEDVGRPLVLDLGQDRDLVVLGQLLEDVGEPLVVQRRRDLEAALRRELVDDVGEVGRLELVHRGEQVGGALALLDDAEVEVGDRDDERLAAAPQPAGPDAAARTRG